MSNRIVVIDSGAAAASSVKIMRSIDSQSEILVFGEEKTIPTTALKYLRGYRLWGSANQQGKIAGANICNQNMTFEPAPPLTTMDAFGLPFYSIGDIIEHEGTELLIEKYDENKKYTKLLLRDNIIVGAIVIGDSKRFMLLKSLIERKAKAQIKKSALPEVREFILELQNSNKTV